MGFISIGFSIFLVILIGIKVRNKLKQKWCKSKVCLVGKTVIVTGANTGILKKSAPSRIINVSSLAAKYAKLTPENLNTYPGRALNYSNSKLGNILFTMRLAKHLGISGVSVFSLHPGTINTEILRRVPSVVMLACKPIVSLYFRTPEEGAQTTLHASLEQGIEQFSGRHFEECALVPTYENAKNEKLIETIWDKTMELINYDGASSKLK